MNETDGNSAEKPLKVDMSDFVPIPINLEYERKEPTLFSVIIPKTGELGVDGIKLILSNTVDIVDIILGFVSLKTFARIVLRSPAIVKDFFTIYSRAKEILDSAGGAWNEIKDYLKYPNAGEALEIAGGIIEGVKHTNEKLNENTQPK